MKKQKSLFTVLGLLAFFLLCLVPSGSAQQGSPVPYINNPAQLALSWTFNANSTATGGFTVRGLLVGYLRDPRSCDYATLLEWVKPS